MSEENQNGVAQVRKLGIERWVQFGFIALGAVLFWFLDKVINASIDRAGTWFDLPEVEGWIVTVVSLALAAGITIGAYRKRSVQAFSRDVAGELSKVQWPDRPETWSNTVVVIITSIIAAIILFAFDSAWSAITDLIYKS